MSISYLVYDCEIINCIPPKDGERDDRYSYCKGWHDHIGMGISVIGYYSSRADEYGYTSSLKSFDAIAQSHSLIIGFNSRNFDDKLLAANGLSVQTGYDLLEEIRITAFGSPRWQDTPKGCSYSLGVLAEANGYQKTGRGDLAPVWWQDGEFQKVIDYCLQDVKVTVELLKLGLQGELIDPNTGKKLKLRELAECTN